MKSYSNLTNIIEREVEPGIYSFGSHFAHRDKVPLDNSCKVYWNGIDLWANFGAFITTNKAQTFYNPSSFSNNYTSPQFSSSVGNLTGVTFERKKISFTLSVYRISLHDYKRLMNLFNAYTIGFLSFGNNMNYGFLVKPTGIADSEKYYLGKDLMGFAQDTLVSEDSYYTELKLTFELQGEQCAYGLNLYESETKEFNILGFKSNNDFIASDLNFPLLVDFEIKLNQNITGQQPIALEAIAYLLDAENNINNKTKVTLFNINIINLPLLTENNLPTNYTLSLQYNSEKGLLTYKHGNNNILLSALSTASNGKRILNKYIVNQLWLPGLLEDRINAANLKEKFRIQFNITNATIENAIFTGRARSNVI